MGGAGKGTRRLFYLLGKQALTTTHPSPRPGTPLCISSSQSTFGWRKFFLHCLIAILTRRPERAQGRQ